MAVLGAVLALGQVPVLASAAEPGAGEVVVGDTGDALPSLSEVTIEPTADGFEVGFDWVEPPGGARPEGATVHLGIYEGDPSQYPFSSATVTEHGYGDGPVDPLVPVGDDRSGHYSGSFSGDRTTSVTVMLFSSQNCDCPAGTVFAAGRTLAPAPLVTGTPSVVGTLAVGTVARAEPGEWSAGTTFTYQWYGGDEPLTGATEASLLLGPELAGSALRVEVTGTSGTREPVTVSSAPSPLVIAPGTVAIGGSPRAGQTVTADTTGWDPDTRLEFQWSVDGVPVDGETGASLEVGDSLVGAIIAVTVTATHPSYATATVRSPEVTVLARALDSALPTITGTLAVGSSVQVVAGPWTSGTSLAYQWFVDGAAVPGATGSTVALTSAHVGKPVSVAVTGTLSGHEGVTQVSTATALVVAPGTPKISGTASTGNTLTASPGTWAAGTTFAYQWLADGVPVAGATASKITLASTRSGAAMSVRVTASRPRYATVVRTSAPSARVMRWSRPTISGSVAYGFTLSARPGTWTPGVALVYRWYADGKSISGATRSTLKLGSAQKGRRISVRVTGSKSGHPSVAVTSSSSAKVITSARPSISGTPQYGKTLTARARTWTSSTRFRYAWLADGVVIKGATSSSLKLTGATKGKRITLRVTGSRSGYATVARTSASTRRVATTAAPVVSGSPRVTHTLTARTGTWSSGTSFRYRWYANGKAISKATRSTLKLGSGLVGKRIKVRVTGSRSGYPTISRTSSSTSAVAYPGRTTPTSSWNCPSWAPIKGNASSMIYHVRSGAFYTRTKPEECFRTESAAKAAGYRRSLR